MGFDIPVPEISPTELKSRLDKGDALVIIDVREPHEVQIAALPPTPNSLHIPIGEFTNRAAELDVHKEHEIVVYCKVGGRSEMAANFLRAHGFKSVYNLKGGILAWSRDVDQTVPQY